MSNQENFFLFDTALNQSDLIRPGENEIFNANKLRSTDIADLSGVSDGEVLTWSNALQSWTFGATGGITCDGNGNVFITSTGTVGGSATGNTVVGCEAANIQITGSNNIYIGNTPGITAANNTIILGNSENSKVEVSENTLAIGFQAGRTSQGSAAVAVGYFAGRTSQGINGISIGDQSGSNNQGTNSIAIGSLAGNQTQGENSIAIGELAGQTSQPANSIVLNASGSALNAPAANSTVISSIRDATLANNQLLMWNANEIIKSTATTSASSKTFVINHPLEKEKYLVHACLEGPEVGIYYRGRNKLNSKGICKVKLPDYAKEIGTEFTVVVSGECENENDLFTVNSTKVNKKGEFTIFGSKPNRNFNWFVQGKRKELEVEVMKNSVKKYNKGPYTWIEKINSE